MSLLCSPANLWLWILFCEPQTGTERNGSDLTKIKLATFCFSPSEVSLEVSLKQTLMTKLKILRIPWHVNSMTEFSAWYLQTRYSFTTFRLALNKQLSEQVIRGNKILLWSRNKCLLHHNKIMHPFYSCASFLRQSFMLWNSVFQQTFSSRGTQKQEFVLADLNIVQQILSSKWYF